MAENTNENVVVSGNGVANEARKKALETISRINAVEGFDPTAVTKEVESVQNPGQKENFLPLIWKKAWARMVYPMHRCHAKITEIKDGVVAAYAAFYVDNDPTKEAIGEGFAFNTIDLFEPDPAKARSNAISLALGSAKSRAYTDAGFGLQFWTDDCIDDLQAASIAQMQASATTPAPSDRGEASQIPLTEGTKQDGSLASMIPLSSPTQETVQEETEENTSDESAEGPKKAPRKSQYETAKAENDELIQLADQLTTTVDCIMTATIGSTEHDAAKKTMESIKGKWAKITADLAEKFQKPSVQEAKAKDTEYTFFAKTFDQVVAEAKAASRMKTAVSAETPEDAVADLPVASDVPTEPVEQSVVSEENTESTADSVQNASQTTVFMMSVEDARAVVSTNGSYAGKTIGELYDNTVTRRILPKLFERTDEKNERLAIKTIIESDQDLVAYCERNGKILEV